MCAKIDTNFSIFDVVSQELIEYLEQNYNLIPFDSEHVFEYLVALESSLINYIQDENKTVKNLFLTNKQLNEQVASKSNDVVLNSQLLDAAKQKYAAEDYGLFLNLIQTLQSQVNFWEKKSTTLADMQAYICDNQVENQALTDANQDVDTQNNLFQGYISQQLVVFNRYLEMVRNNAAYPKIVSKLNMPLFVSTSTGLELIQEIMEYVSVFGVLLAKFNLLSSVYKSIDWTRLNVLEDLEFTTIVDMTNIKTVLVQLKTADSRPIFFKENNGKVYSASIKKKKIEVNIEGTIWNSKDLLSDVDSFVTFSSFSNSNGNTLQIFFNGSSVKTWKNTTLTFSNLQTVTWDVDIFIPHVLMLSDSFSTQETESMWVNSDLYTPRPYSGTSYSKMLKINNTNKCG